MDFRAITLSGEVGSGKSSIAKALQNLLPGWERINTGQRFRDFCASKGMSIQEVSELPDELHKEFDADQRHLLKNEKNVIVEGRLAGWLARDIEDVYRVYCQAPIEVRVRRYMQRDSVPYQQALENVLYRDEKDLEKFHRIYGVKDYRDPDFYHLVIDTSTEPPLKLAQHILKKASMASSD